MIEGLHEKNHFYYYNDDKKILDPDFLKKDKPMYFISMSPFYHTDVNIYFTKKINHNHYSE